MKRVHEILSRLLSNPKIGKLLIFMGIIGIILIFLSDYFPKETEATSQTLEFDSYTAYAQYLEKELSEIIKDISGAGKTEVFISLEASGEYVYAYDQTKTEEIKDSSSEHEKQTQDEKTHVIKNVQDKGEEPVIIAQLAPNVNGVLVVCSGGDDLSVQKNIRQAVSSALGIAETKVYVTKRN